MTLIWGSPGDPKIGYVFRPSFCSLRGNFRSAAVVELRAKLQSQAPLGKAVLRLSADRTGSHLHQELAKVPWSCRGSEARWKAVAKTCVLVEVEEWLGKTLPQGLIVKFVKPALHLMGWGRGRNQGERAL